MPTKKVEGRLIIRDILFANHQEGPRVRDAFSIYTQWWQMFLVRLRGAINVDDQAINCFQRTRGVQSRKRMDCDLRKFNSFKGGTKNIWLWGEKGTDVLVTKSQI